MFDFLWFPIAFFGGLAVYALFDRRLATKASSPAVPPAPLSGVSALASVRILAATSTNNSYDPMGDVLASLDLPEVQELLEGTLNADMEGYMS